MSSQDFLRYTLNKLGVDYSIASGNIGSIPDEGSSIVVANHSFGENERE